jgi:spore maturation protein CgeB
MYRALQRSLVTFNSHVPTSRIARNMRLFEATGVGACLITDWRENMNDLFADGTEIVTYRSKEECLEKLRWLIAHPEETRQIAASGQRRCLSDHTYRSRAAILDEIITRQLARA